MKKIMILCCLLVSTSAMAQVYKCKDDKGKLEYQASPCATKSEEKLRLFNESHPDDAQEAALSAAERSRFNELVSQGKVAIGMTKRMVLKSWGQPNKINISIGSYGRSEQWVYANEYVYVENGVVKSLQASR